VEVSLLLNTFEKQFMYSTKLMAWIISEELQKKKTYQAVNITNSIKLVNTKNIVNISTFAQCGERN
jgi:hypothetical protein